MALVAMYGFNHCNKAVQSDGISPVDGVGVTDSGYALNYINANPTWVFGGVVSDTSQAMGKAPARQPLVFKQMGNSSAPSSGNSASSAGGCYIQVSVTTTTNSIGFRFAWDYDGNASTGRSTYTPIVVVASNTNPASSAGTRIISLDVINQQLRCITTAYSLPPLTECYIELFQVGSGSTYVRFNGVQVPSSLSTSSPPTYRIGLPSHSSDATGFVTPTNTGRWGLVKICDLYATDNTGAAPWNGSLGPVKIQGVPFNKLVSNTMDVSPSGTDALDALGTLGDDETLVTTGDASAVEVGLTSVPAGVDGQILAIQSFVTATMDVGYGQSMTMTESANGTSADPVPVTLAANTSATGTTPIRTALPDGTTLSVSTLLDYQLTVASA